MNGLRRLVTLFALVLLVPPMAFGQDAREDIQKELDREFADRLLVLKGYPRARKLVFNASGQPLGDPDFGTGPTDGLFHVKSIRVDRERLTVTGSMPVSALAKGEIRRFPSSMQRRAEIHFSNASLDYEALRKAFLEIFLTRGETDPNLQPCTSEELDVFQKTVQRMTTLTYEQKLQDPESAADHVLCFPDGVRVATVGKSITPPKAVSTPDPHYPEAARQSRVEGTVKLIMIVDKTGRPSEILVAQPIGNGFDENAVEMVHRWRFRPATRNGEPVAVVIAIEVNFRLWR